MKLLSFVCRVCKRPHLSTPSAHANDPRCPFCHGDLEQR